MLLFAASDDCTDSLGNIEDTVEVPSIGRDDVDEPLFILSPQ